MLSSCGSTHSCLLQVSSCTGRLVDFLDAVRSKRSANLKNDRELGYSTFRATTKHTTQSIALAGQMLGTARPFCQGCDEFEPAALPVRLPQENLVFLQRHL